MTVTLLHGDCLELLPAVADGSVDMVFADLPYGVTANKWDSVIPFEPLWEQLLRVGKRNAAFVFTATFKFACRLERSQPDYCKYDIVWLKPMLSGMLNARKMPLRGHELIVVFYRAQPTYNPQKIPGTRKRNDASKVHSTNYGAQVSVRHTSDGTKHPPSYVTFGADPERFKGATRTLHPTQKPVALMEWLVRTYSDPGDTVLDPAMGSGSCGVACVNTGRSFVGMERDASYFETGKRRVESTLMPLLPDAA